jgi:hypothetical protein
MNFPKLGGMNDIVRMIVKYSAQRLRRASLRSGESSGVEVPKLRTFKWSSSKETCEEMMNEDVAGPMRGEIDPAGRSPRHLRAD